MPLNGVNAVTVSINISGNAYKFIILIYKILWGGGTAPSHTPNPVVVFGARPPMPLSD